jgi:hypothetical protein
MGVEGPALASPSGERRELKPQFLCANLRLFVL